MNRFEVELRTLYNIILIYKVLFNNGRVISEVPTKNIYIFCYLLMQSTMS